MPESASCVRSVSAPVVTVQPFVQSLSTGVTTTSARRLRASLRAYAHGEYSSKEAVFTFCPDVKVTKDGAASARKSPMTTITSNASMSVKPRWRSMAWRLMAGLLALPFFGRLGARLGPVTAERQGAVLACYVLRALGRRPHDVGRCRRRREVERVLADGLRRLREVQRRDRGGIRAIRQQVLLLALRDRQQEPGRRRTVAPAHIILIGRIGDRGENPDDHDGDHQLDQRKTPCAHGRRSSQDVPWLHGNASAVSIGGSATATRRDERR